jgi:osmotically-inducible protein OsmY
MSDGVLIGVVSRMDFVTALRASGKAGKTADVGDDAIGRHVKDALRGQPWTFGCSIDVPVEDGEVTLDGEVTNQSQKGAARAAAECADGVKRVVDLLRVYERPIAETV